MSKLEAPTVDARALEALARAYDREDSAQRGEPDPWLPDLGGDDAQWHAERIACAEEGLRAYLTALSEQPAALSRVQEPVAGASRLFDDHQPMACEVGEITAAEDVLSWLIIEKCGAPDDRSYTPHQAQKIIEDALALATPPAPQGDAFKPCIFVNEEAKITEATFEDVAHVALPVFDGVHHWIDKHLALDDGRMVGMAVWATLPPRQGEVPAADELHTEIRRLRKALTLSDADRRLWFISDLLGKRLYFNRYEICEAFGVSIPQASIDIRRWMEKHPGAIKYNKSLKRYEAASPAASQEGE